MSKIKLPYDEFQNCKVVFFGDILHFPRRGAGSEWIKHAPARENFSFPAEVQVLAGLNTHPRGKIRGFLFGESVSTRGMCVRVVKNEDFCRRGGFSARRTCVRGVKFEVFWSANLFRGGECASASRKFKKSPFFPSKIDRSPAGASGGSSPTTSSAPQPRLTRWLCGFRRRLLFANKLWFRLSFVCSRGCAVFWFFHSANLFRRGECASAGRNLRVFSRWVLFSTR